MQQIWSHPWIFFLCSCYFCLLWDPWRTVSDFRIRNHAESSAEVELYKMTTYIEKTHQVHDMFNDKTPCTPWNNESVYSSFHNVLIYQWMRVRSRSQDNQYTGRHFNPGPQYYEARMLYSRLRRSDPISSVKEDVIDPYCNRYYSNAGSYFAVPARWQRFVVGGYVEAST
jgi:hypothetical protein